MTRLRQARSINTGAEVAKIGGIDRGTLIGMVTAAGTTMGGYALTQSIHGEKPDISRIVLIGVGAAIIVYGVTTLINSLMG